MGKGDLYKFLFKQSTGNRVLKADPFANYAELRPATASVVWDLTKYSWKDEKWLARRSKWNSEKEPVLVYEVALGPLRNQSLQEEKRGTASIHTRRWHLCCVSTVKKWDIPM